MVTDGEESIGANDIVKVFSSRKELIFEYDARAEKARIHVPSGDLDLVTDNGRYHVECRRQNKIQW